MRAERVGVIAAMAAEAASWPRAAHAPQSNYIIKCSGIGPIAAAAATQALLAQDVDWLIAWGTAGGLENALRPGTIVLYDSVIDAANGSEYPCDAARTATLARQLEGFNVVHCRGLTVATPIASAKHKQALHAHFQCSAVDMESASIAALAAHAGKPFSVLRVIVDPADFALPKAAVAANNSTWPQWLAVLFALLRRPRELPALLTLAGWYRAALSTLGDAASTLSAAQGA